MRGRRKGEGRLASPLLSLNVVDWATHSVSDNAEVGGGERARDGGGSVVVRFSHERDAGANGSIRYARVAVKLTECGRDNARYGVQRLRRIMTHAVC